MSFLKRIFTKRKDHRQELEDFLKQNHLLKMKISNDFFDVLKQYIIGHLDGKEDEANLIRFKAEFNPQLEDLKKFLHDTLVSNLSNESLEAFYEKHREMLTRKYEFPGTKIMLCSYWFQIIRSIERETRESGDETLIQRFNPYFLKLKESSLVTMESQK